MYRISFTNKFKKDAQLCKRRGYPTNLLNDIVKQLMIYGKVDASLNPHPLTGKYSEHWECHIKPNWLLIWKKVDFDFTINQEDNKIIKQILK